MALRPSHHSTARVPRPPEAQSRSDRSRQLGFSSDAVQQLGECHGPSIAGAAARTPVNSLHVDSPLIHEDSRGALIDVKRGFLADINETRTRLNRSVEVMAINAGCHASAMSDALNDRNGRNFAGHWLEAQGEEFLDTYHRVRAERLGSSPAAQRARDARDISEIVRRLVERIA